MLQGRRFPAAIAFVAGLLTVSLAQAEYPKPAAADIPDHSFYLLAFGGVGDGKTSNTAAFQKAFKTIADAGGGRLIVPAGRFVTGSISLASRCELHLEKGAVIQFPADIAAYGLPAEPSDRDLKSLQKRVPALIQGQNLHDVAITGTGTIDGGGEAWWDLAATDEDGFIHDFGSSRPKLIVLTNIQRLHVEGVTLRDSPRWTLTFDRSRDVLIDGVHVFAPEDSPNTDGIDPNGSENVVIRNCDLDVGDDNIAIKAISAPAHDILVDNCRCLHGRGISIGSETYKGIHDVTVRNCTFDGTAHGIHIKSARDRGNQLFNFNFSNIAMKNVSLPISINLYYQDHFAQFERQPKPVTATTPHVHDVHIDGLTATAADGAGEIIGLPEAPIAGVTMSNVKISATTGLVVTDARAVVFKSVDIHVTEGAPVIAQPGEVAH